MTHNTDNTNDRMTGEYIVMCRVSGGVTGTRLAPLKANGVVQYFETREAAEAEAVRLMNRPGGGAVRFQYWAEEVTY